MNKTGLDRIFVSGLLLGLVALPLQSARADEDPNLKQGIRLLDEMEDAKALEAFEKALARPGNTAKDRALIYFYIGVAHSNRFNEQAAEAHFRKALAEDAAFHPPEMIAPKIKTRFEQIRAAFLAEKARQTPTKRPEEKSQKERPKEHRRVERGQPAPAPPPVVARARDTETPAGRSGTINWPAWVTLGVAAAATVAGTVMAVQFAEENDKATDLSLTYPEAIAHHDRAESRGLAANILFSVAGAAAITSGVLFYLKWRKRESAEASLLPLSSGAIVQVKGTWR